MRGPYVKIEVDDNELQSIFNELSAAQEKICECYNRLEELGVVVFKSKAASGN